MRPFWRSFWASILAYIVLSVLIIVFINVIVFSIGNSLNTKKPLVIKKNSYLEMKLDFSIKERGGLMPGVNMLNPVIKNHSISDVVNAIEKAKNDNNIKGIVLRPENISIDLSNIHVLRNKLNEFKESGKFIISYAEYYSLGSYYISSVADQVFLYPEGMLDYRGLSTELMFFKGAIEKYGVDVQIIRGSGNDYKSAVEPFMYNKMSDENRYQLKSILNTLWNNMNQDIGKNRGITNLNLNQIADSVLAYNAAGGLKQNLIDATLYEDELDSIVNSKFSLNENEKANKISFKKYLKKQESKKKFKLSKKSNLAVIYAEGEIRSGENQEGVMGSETIVKAINKAKNDSLIKAIVLRVNSPGGSALASDVIWRALELAKKNKPVVVSMGSVAASGGYYISCGADRIFASTNTITGSIGVFGVVPSVGRMLNENIGLSFDRVETNPHASMSPFNTLDPFEFGVYQKAIDEIYDTFLTRVSDGRPGLTKKEVHELAKGRVWTSENALENQLIDEIGTVDDAINYAANLADINNDDIKILELPKIENDPFLEIISELEIDVSSIDQNELSTLITTLNKQFKSSPFAINSKDRYQSFMPFEFSIK
ncbi:MAG: signal peptide peptidase SppA [Bacteroidota bacterium]|nr:signal peptide peptidase SppA [Bacteroidota bacterium]